MNYASIKNCDIANGIGVRVSLFVSGCTHHCKGCFNSETWNFDYGETYTPETETKIIRMLEPSYIKGLSLLGGEPFEPQNQPELIKLVRRVKNIYSNKDIWCYSGYTFEQIIAQPTLNSNITARMIEYIDVLVDGEFIEEQKDISLVFKGSYNQRIIDVKASLASGRPILWAIQ